MRHDCGKPTASSSDRFAPKIDRRLGVVAEHGDLPCRRHAATALLIIMTVVLSVAFVFVGVPENTAAESHNPIYIDDDSDFKAAISTSGVRSGTGVQGDPYIISDWEIVADMAHGVDIRNTNAHFIVRNVTVTYDTFSPTLNFNGVNLINANNGTIYDCTFTGWLKKGVYTMGSTNLLVIGNSVSIEPSPARDRYGIEVYSSPMVDVKVQENVITSGDYGIKISFTDEAWVEANEISSVTTSGLLLQSSEGDTVWSNTMIGCGIDIWANSVAESNTHDIPTNNTANGDPIYYEKDQTGVTYDGVSAGQLIFANCQDVTVQDMSFADCDVGVLMYYCEAVSLTRVTVTDTLYDGIWASFVEGLEMTECTISGSGRFGLEIWYGVDFTVVGCDIVSNGNSAVMIQYGVRLNLTECNLSGNSGVGHCGVDYRMGDNTTDTQSSITYNTISNNYCGVSLYKCRGVWVHHNNFVDNTMQAGDSEADLNHWDNGTEGNYWSDYSGVDVSPIDGIGDTPYEVDGDTYDNYPLMEIHVIPEFGTVLVPIVFVLALFAVLRRRAP